MITKSDRLTLSIIILLVESSHALSAVGVNLYWPVVYLTHGLQLNIVSPNARLAFPLAVLYYIFVCDKHFEILITQQNVLHALLPDLQVVIRCTVNLVRDASEETISIAFHFYDHEVFFL